jgi:excisionase family DNA binding protein
MARKFLTLEEAAKLLGVTVETLGELRDRREVHGYRDGASWKFKEEDVERLKVERASAAEEGEFAEMDEDPDSILLSEVELGHSNRAPQA